MTSVYDIISTIKTFLRDHPIVNYVNYGDITQGRPQQDYHVSTIPLLY